MNTATQGQGGERDLPDICAADRQYTSEGIGVSYQIVATPESEIKKNNRLALMVDIHSRRQAKGKPQKTEDVMAINKKKAVCDCCKRDKLNLSGCSGDVICSSCASLYGAINNRLPILASAVERLGKADALVGQLVKNLGQPWLMTVVQAHLPEQVAVNVENETLDQVAQLVGYTGESGEGLLAVIADLAAIKTERDDYQSLADGRLRAVNMANHTLDQITELVSYEGASDNGLVAVIAELVAIKEERGPLERIAELEQLLDRIGTAVGYEAGIGEGSDRQGLVEAVVNLDVDRNLLLTAGPPADLTRALGLPEDALWSTAEYAAIQTAALLEYYQVESVVQAVEASSDPAIWDSWLLRLRDLLGMPVSRPSELIDAIEGKLDELEECRQRCEQLDQPQNAELDAIRRALGVTDPRYNLVAAISEMAGTIENFKRMAEYHEKRADGYVDKSDRYAAEKNILADQLSNMERIAANLEQTNTVNEQIFARIRELLDADGLSNGEIPSAIDSILHEGLVNPGVRINERFSDKLMASEAGGPLHVPGRRMEPYLTWNDPVVTEALVDFALRCLSGKITLVHRGVA